MLRAHASDVIHGAVVIFIVIAATIYASISNDHSDNIWIVYGSGIAFAAGRAGSAVITRQFAGTRASDPGTNG